jgi:hypothetical protein
MRGREEEEHDEDNLYEGNAIEQTLDVMSLLPTLTYAFCPYINDVHIVVRHRH